MVAQISHKSSLRIERIQATRQLNYLGFERGDKVPLRFFYHSDDPRKDGDKGRKLNRLQWEEVERIQSEGRGVYIVVNGHNGGHEDKDINQCAAIFCEWDDMPLEDQMFHWESVGFFEPTFTVYSGDKSMQPYWIFHEPLTNIKQWRELQQLLIEVMKADPANKNPSRVFRLAGGWHIKPGREPVQTQIVQDSGKKYSIEELLMKLREVKRQQQPVKQPSSFTRYEDIQVPVPESIPLEVCLSKESRSLLNSGVSEGGRNTNGAKLARDLIGTGDYLASIGQQFDGDALSLLYGYANLCNSPLPTKEVEAIWKSAQKDRPGSSCPEHFIENNIRAWYWREHILPKGRGYGSKIGGGNRRNFGGGSGGDGGDGDGGDCTGKVVRFPIYETLTPELVTGKIDELIVQGASGSYLTGQLNRLAAASQIYTQELRKLYFERLAECDLESDRGDNKTQVENLLNLGDQSLELRDYLPQDLADPLTLWCSWLSIRPEVALTALLTGASSLHKVGTELVIHRDQTFRVPPTIFSGLVSESGQKKSPIFSNIIRHPLNELRQEKIDAYNAAMEDYKAAMESWEQSESKGRKPEPPKDPTLYYFTNATGEAIPVQASKAPEKALLALIDELSGLFNSANSYRGGRGSDKQDTLSYFDGSGQTVLRANGVKVDVRNIYLSIFGTIQPEVLKNHMADCSDPDGQWARFLFVNQPLAAATLSDDDGKFIQIRDRLTGFYRQIDQLPVMEYRLSRPAFKRYQLIYNQLEKLRVTHPRAAMRAVYSKMEGYIGRLALNLHVIWEIAAGKACPEEEIPLFIMEMAIDLAKFYIGQVKLVHSFSDEEGLAPGLVKLFELSKRLDTNGKDGWVKAQQYRELFAAKKRPSAQQARSLMLEAQSMGVGRTRGTGNRLEYHWLCDNNNGDDNPPSPMNNLGNLGKLREDLGKDVPYVETVATKEIEDNLGNLGKGIPNFSLTQNMEVPLSSSSRESSLEGGYVPEPSLSSPQEVCDIDPVVSSELGNNLGNPFPNPSLSSLSAIAPMPLEQTNATSADETEEEIASTPANVDADERENPVTAVEIEPEVVPTSVEDEIGVNDEPAVKEKQWAWNKTTGESLGGVLFIRGSQAKIRRSGELPRHAKFYPLQEITFDNPVVQALSLNASPAATAQWGESEQFIEEVDD
jgi:hypothetical protein